MYAINFVLYVFSIPFKLFKIQMNNKFNQPIYTKFSLNLLRRNRQL